MEEADTDGEVVDAVDGVTLRKRYEEAEFHQPAVVYEFHSDREDEVAVRVIETIPDPLDPEDMGFLGSSMERTWEIKGPKLVFENPLEPNEPFTTAVAARGDAADTITELLGHPDAFEVSSTVESDEEVLTRSAGSAEPARSPPNRESNETPEPTTPESEEAAEPDEAAAEPADEPADAATSPGGERVVEQFVEELRAGDVSTESVEFLRDELGADGPPRSVEARLKQLQADLSDVRAYTNALEAFIDEHGTADDIVARLEDRLDGVEATLASLEETLDDQGTNVDRLQADVDDLDAEIAALGRELGDLGDDLAETRTDVARLDEQLPDDVDERLTTLEEELEDVSRFTTSLRAAFED